MILDPNLFLNSNSSRSLPISKCFNDTPFTWMPYVSINCLQQVKYFLSNIMVNELIVKSKNFNDQAHSSSFNTCKCIIMCILLHFTKFDNLHMHLLLSVMIMMCEKGLMTIILCPPFNINVDQQCRSEEEK